MLSIVFSSENKLVRVQKGKTAGEKRIKYRYIREFSGDKVSQTMTIDDVVCLQKLKRNNQKWY
jgi:hypothetical protein